MSDSSQNGSSGGNGASGEGEAPAAKTSSPPEAIGPEAGPASEPEKDPLELAKAEAQKFRDQLLRTAADFDNFRKRARRETDDAGRRGRESLLKELLPVFDNLERAATSAVAATDAKSVAEGVRMVLRQFSTTLERVGITRVATVGKPFDPGLHEAIQHVESTEHSAGLVAAEVQAGYQIGEHLVRAALVVVSKGPGPEGGSTGSSGEGGGPGSSGGEGGGESAPASGEPGAEPAPS
jgi:molecular chaperone GrpE